MNKRISILITFLVIAMTGTSCIKEKLELAYTSQEDKIDKYIEAAIKKDTTATVVRKNGSNRLTLVHGEGEELGENGQIAFYYAGYTFNGSISSSNLFVTNHEQTAIDARLELTDAQFELYEINMADAQLIEGLRNGLLGVKGGEECEILFSGKYGFGNETFGLIPANSALLYKIWVVSISND